MSGRRSTADDVASTPPPGSHTHTFGQDRRRKGESRTLAVIALTGLTMLVEVVAGVKFGSMALLADGLHMASHTVALAITAFAYAYARRHAHDARFSFGTGKVNALGGFTGAVLLALFALYMAGESVLRLLNPVAISFNQAIVVAVLGLAVNGVSVFILDAHDHHHDDAHHHHHHHDHNLRAAYLHVLADALTSLLAILALLSAKFFGWIWMDPIMGVVGAVLVARWSWGLLRSTSEVLLDRQCTRRAQEVREALEQGGRDRVTDLHVWSVGPGIYSAQIALVSDRPATVAEYRQRLPETAAIVHSSIEVHGR